MMFCKGWCGQKEIAFLNLRTKKAIEGFVLLTIQKPESKDPGFFYVASLIRSVYCFSFLYLILLGVKSPKRFFLFSS